MSKHMLINVNGKPTLRAPLARPVRTGKTAKDKAKGAASNRAARQAARAAWQQDNRATNDSFPK